jgi:hypothetical protein
MSTPDTQGLLLPGDKNQIRDTTASQTGPHFIRSISEGLGGSSVVEYLPSMLQAWV